MPADLTPELRALAEKAGAQAPSEEPMVHGDQYWWLSDEQLARFAALVKADAMDHARKEVIAWRSELEPESVLADLAARYREEAPQ